MGQKTNPYGQRVGINQKWRASWYHINNNFYVNNIPNIKTQGLIYSRENTYFSGLEDYLIKIFNRKSIKYFKFKINFILVDFRFFKGIGGNFYGFLRYTKRFGKTKRSLFFK